MQKTTKTTVTVIAAVFGLLTNTNAAEANISEWLEIFSNQQRTDYGQAFDCYDGKLGENACQSLDRRVQRGIMINQGAAASQGIRNGVQQSHYDSIDRNNYHNAIENANYYCNAGDVNNCIFWEQVIESYNQQ